MEEGKIATVWAQFGATKEVHPKNTGTLSVG
jgi:hypothetical protein